MNPDPREALQARVADPSTVKFNPGTFVLTDTLNVPATIVVVSFAILLLLFSSPPPVTTA